jgi:hypothetical protein
MCAYVTTLFVEWMDDRGITILESICKEAVVA